MSDSPDTKKRLLLLIPSMNFGGAQRVLHGHSQSFAKQYEVSECVFNQELGTAFPSGAPLYSLDVGGGGSAVGKALNLARRVRKLSALKKKLGIDVCISHLEGADYVNLLSKGREKVVLVVHGTKMHDANISGPLGTLRKRALIPALYRRADAIVTVSQAIRHELIHDFSLPAGKITAIPNYFDVSRIEDAAKEPIDGQYEEVFSKFPTVATSGRLVVQKNQAELVELFAKLVTKVPTARLVLVGDGELRKHLEDRCTARGLTFHASESGTPPGDAQVLFLGFQQNPFRWLARSTVFVLPSEWEGFPMALGEAMAVGLPCISADCPTGPRELLSTDEGLHRPLTSAERREFGVLMPRLDGRDAPREAWADELATFLNDESLRKKYSAAAHERIQYFDQRSVMSRWDSLLQSLGEAAGG